MKFNLPYILQNGMKILNIVNKTLPLVKEVNPALNFIQKKLKSQTPMLASKQKNTKTINNSPSVNKNISNKNNTLTFFR